MPLPKPKRGESRRDFVPRCMADPGMVDEYPKKPGQKVPKQRYAVCARIWSEGREDE